MIVLGLVLAGLTVAQSTLWTSPLVPPPPGSAGLGDWAEAYAKARKLVSQLTLEEKVNITYGREGVNGAGMLNSCAGNSGTLSKHGFDGFCFHDGPGGLSGTDMVNGYPAGLHMATTWNRDLVGEVALHTGREFRKKGVHVALAPVVGALGRVVRGGRTSESYGPDPYLSGALISHSLPGIQQSVISAVKHFVANEQETYRRSSGPNDTIKATSMNIDDRTMHELYLWSFQEAVRSGATCIMCSYNRVNNSHSCDNSKMLNGLLKGELGFQGFTLTDWAAEASPTAAQNGLDLYMPFPGPFENLGATFKANPSSQPRLDDMATRILAAWYKIGLDKGFPPRGVGMPVALTDQHKLIDARDKASKPSRLQAAIEGHVLVKNIKNALPLKAPRMLGLYGYNAQAAPVQMQDPNPNIPFFSSWLLGLLSLNVSDEFLTQVAMNPLTHQLPGSARKGHVMFTGGSAAIAPSYIHTPFSAVHNQAVEDDTQLYWDFEKQDPNVNGATEACLVFLNEFQLENQDRAGLADPWSDQLVVNVAKKCSNTIVVINNAGIRLVDAWINNPNVTAVILAGLPGQESGKALVEILYGRQSPSGRLPYTIAKKDTDYGHVLNPQGVPPNPQADFTEGVYIDYRHFIAQNITPRYEFGYGMSYTTFKYSSLDIMRRAMDAKALSIWPEKLPILPGGNPTLFQSLAKVEAKIQNTGSMESAEVAQLYVGIPGDAPARQLRGFSKPHLNPGQTKTVSFDLRRKDLSVWNVEKQEWELRRGEYNIYVGSSVLDIKLRGSFTLGESGFTTQRMFVNSTET